MIALLRTTSIAQVNPQTPPVHRASRPFTGALPPGGCPPLPRPRQSLSRRVRRGPRPAPAAQLRAVGCDQPAPHAVLADIPMPQRQHQALALDQATGAHRDRSGGLLARPARINADREPPVRVKAAIGTPAMPDHPGPQSIADRHATAKWMGWRIVTPSRVRPEDTVRARDMPGEAVMCSLLLHRLRSTLPGHPGPASGQAPVASCRPKPLHPAWRPAVASRIAASSNPRRPVSCSR